MGAISRVGRRRIESHPRRLAPFRATLCAEPADAAMRHSSNPFGPFSKSPSFPGLVDPTAAWETLLIYMIPDAGFTAVGVPTDRATAVVIVGLGAVTGVRQRTTAMAISQRHQVT